MLDCNTSMNKSVALAGESGLATRQFATADFLSGPDLAATATAKQEKPQCEESP